MLWMVKVVEKTEVNFHLAKVRNIDKQTPSSSKYDLGIT